MERVFLLCFSVLVHGQFEDGIPTVNIEAFKDGGLRVSVKDVEGLQFVAFHGNIDKPIKVKQEGDLAYEITKPTNGRWEFLDENVDISIGNSIFYWFYVQINDLGMSIDSKKWDMTHYSIRERIVGPGNCEASLTTVNEESVCSGRLVFEDDFNVLNTSIWSRDIRIGDVSPDFEFVSYQNRNENCKVEGGVLEIKPTLIRDEVFVRRGILNLTRCSGNIGGSECFQRGIAWNILPPVVSARWTTKSSFSLKFGKIEIRAKLPQGDWLYPEIVLKSKHNDYGDEFASGQIKIAFNRGNKNLEAKIGGVTTEIGGRRLEAGIIIGAGGLIKNIFTRRGSAEHWSERFHTFGLNWTPDLLTFTVDGSTMGTIKPPELGFGAIPEFQNEGVNLWLSGQKIAPFDKEFFLSLSVAAGGTRYFPDNSTSGENIKPWKNSGAKGMLNFWKKKHHWFPTWNEDNSALKIDYIRIWSL